MDDFWNWAVKWWIAVLFGALLALIKWLYASHKKKKLERAAQREALVAILYDRLTQAYSYFAHLGYCQVQDRHNFTKLYKAYSANGGNDNMEDIMQRLYDLPTEEHSDKQKED